MAHQEIALSRRNFLLGLVNGAVTMLGLALLDTGTVLTAFIVQLMGGNVIWVGLVTSVINSATQWPAVALANRLETHPRRLPYYRVSALARTVAWLGLGLVLVRGWGLSNLALFLIVTGAFFLRSVGGGVGIIPFWSIVSDTVPPDWRGRFFGIRQLTGGLLCVGAGFYVRAVLGETSPYPFPQNYGVLALWATVATALGTGAFCLFEEPPAAAQRRQVPLLVQLRRGPRLFRRDPNYRRLLRANLAYGLSMAIVGPFIVPYALKHMHVAAAAVGMMLIARQLAYSLSSFAWSYISDARGNRLLLIITSCLCLTVPLAMLAAPLTPERVVIHVLGLPLEASVVYLLAVFVLLGLTTGGLELGANNYLLELAPPRKRSTYLGFLSTLNVPLAWAPLLGALLIGRADRFLLGFGLSLAAAIVCLYNVLRLSEVRYEENGNAR